MKRFEGFMKGINLGGWLSQCGMNYNDEHYSTFITKDDIKEIAGYGIDHFRLPVDYNVIQNEDGTFIPDRFKYIDNALAWAAEYGLNVVLDIHKTKGFVFDDASYCAFFEEEALQKQFIELWEELAKRYGSNKRVAFELLNEVTEPRMAEPWNAIIRKTVPAIRAIAPETPIVVGGIYNSSIFGLTLMEAPCTENMIYTFHCYSPFVYTHQGAGWIASMDESYRTAYPQKASAMRAESLKVFGDDFDHEFAPFGDEMLDYRYFEAMFKQAIDVAEKYDVPLYCGEYGVIDRTDCDSTLRWYKDIHEALGKYDIARSAWTYKKMDFGVTQDNLKPVYEEIKALLGK